MRELHTAPSASGPTLQPTTTNIMSSKLKRKTGPGENAGVPKRTKSTKEVEVEAPDFENASNSWDAAFGRASGMDDTKQELATVNDADELEGQDFLNYIEQQRQAKALQTESSAKAQKWRLSDPVGGRMVDIDPIFTRDEKYVDCPSRLGLHLIIFFRYLIVANSLTLRVYSTSTSLLMKETRLEAHERADARIVAYCLSPSSPQFVWVACSDGLIYRIDWLAGTGADSYWAASSTGVQHMTAASMISAGRTRDVLFTTERRKDEGFRITAHELTQPDDTVVTVARTIYTSPHAISFLKTVQNGEILVAVSQQRLLLANLRNDDYNTIDKIRYEFNIFESSDHITTVDVRTLKRPGEDGKKKSSFREKLVAQNMVDVVIGDVRGAIFVHHDLMYKLNQAHKATKPTPSLTPRKLHWHRKAVNSVKWSLDGMFARLSHDSSLTHNR